MKEIVVALGYTFVLVPLFFYGVNGYVLLWWRKRWKAPARAVPIEWPSVTVQLPIYNERDVVARVIEAAGRLRYPGKLDIQLLDDSTDDTAAIAARVIARVRARGVNIEHIRRANRVGYKAGALAHGLTLSEADLVLILDADFVPEESFLVDTVPYFTTDDIACVQGRWGHLNRDASGFTRSQALGIDVHFTIEQRARAAAQWTVAFNGTAGLWRRSALEDAGGWSADTLTEDLDLSYRAWLRGWRIVYADRAVCPAELPEDMLAFKAQQRRWARGSTTTARKLLGRIWRADVGLGAKVQATLHLTHYAVHPLILASAALALPFGLVAPPGASLWTILPALAMATGGPIGMSLAAAAESDAGEPWLTRLRDVAALVLIGTGLAVSNTVAVFRGLSTKPAEFRRTPKGGAASSYRVAADGLGLAELGCAVACGALAGWLAHRGIVTMVPFLLLYAVGLGYVGFATLRDSARRSERSIELSEKA